jgi:hypothetical protein
MAIGQNIMGIEKGIELVQNNLSTIMDMTKEEQK